MSDKEWYEGLTAEELEGKHVHAVYKTGTVVEGRLERDGLMYVSHTRQVAVLGPGKGGSWELSPGVESVSLVWDERDWEQVRTVDISEADAIVVNGHLLHVDTAYPDYFFTREGASVSTPVYAVSHALRRKYGLPTEPGYYRDDFGIVFVLISDKSAEWYVMPNESKDSPIPPKSVATHLPLTPVHFVDGRAE